MSILSQRKYISQPDGFTIVELLIVIVVIGILAAISVVAFQGVQARAVYTQQLADMSNNMKKIQAFKADYDRWPLHNEITGSGLNPSYVLKVSDKSQYIKDPKAGQHNHTNFVLCYYVESSTPSYIWPAPANADGVIISFSSDNGKHYVANVYDAELVDVTDTFNAALTSDPYATACQTAQTEYDVRAGTQANLYPAL